MAELEDLQYTLGEGPCQDAFRDGAPVDAPHLDDVAARRWPNFTETALASGIEAVFSYPLASCGSKIGVLTIYQDRAGELTARQHEDSLAMAEVLAETLLDMQGAAQPGMLAVEFDEAATDRAEVHQAAGMVSVQLDISVADATVRLRAYAFAEGMSVRSVAADVVARRLRLLDDRGPSAKGPTIDDA